MTTDTDQRQLHVPGACNVRDLGGYFTAGGQTRWRRYLRSDSLHDVQAEGADVLRQAGVHTVVDLREPREAAHAPGPWTGPLAVAYHNIPLFSGLIPRTATPGDLLHDLYVRALSERGEAFAQVIDTLSEAGDDGAVLFHCSAGKDRTGLVAALLLGAAGVGRDDIVRDYALTAGMLASRMKQMVAVCFQQGIAEEVIGPLLACDPRTMAATLDHLEARYGGVPGYLRHIGVSPEAMSRLQGRLLA